MSEEKHSNSSLSAEKAKIEQAMLCLADKLHLRPGIVIAAVLDRWAEGATEATAEALRCAAALVRDRFAEDFHTRFVADMVLQEETGKPAELERNGYYQKLFDKAEQELERFRVENESLRQAIQRSENEWEREVQRGDDLQRLLNIANEDVRRLTARLEAARLRNASPEERGAL